MTDASAYAWLISPDRRPGAWMREASCFTFLRGATPADVVERAGLPDAQHLDLTEATDAAERFHGEGIAVFDGGDGWTVLYQDNGYPDQRAAALLDAAGINKAVVVFWNVNSVTEFAYWEAGIPQVRFEFPDEINGATPARLADEMRAVGITMENYESDPQAYLARLMALAERITGVHLGPDFLQRELLASRAPEPVLDAEGGFMGTADIDSPPTPWLIAAYDPDLAAAIAAAAPESELRAQTFLIDEVLRSTGLIEEPAAAAAARRLAQGQPQMFEDELIQLISRLDAAVPKRGKPDYANPVRQRREAATMLGDFSRRTRPTSVTFGMGWQHGAWALDSAWPQVRQQVLELLAVR